MSYNEYTSPWQEYRETLQSLFKPMNLCSRDEIKCIPCCTFRKSILKNAIDFQGITLWNPERAM